MDAGKQIPDGIRKRMLTPEGTFSCTYRSKEILDPEIPSGIVLSEAIGRIFYRIERDEQMNLVFIHASPGTGTRRASVSLIGFQRNAALKIYITWSPEKIMLYVGERERPETLRSAVGEPSSRKYYVGSDSSLYWIGGA